ncbi:MAG: 4-vinyl reductase, partial [Desulfobacterales bacterium]
EGHQVILSGQPAAMHCHHYNINLQKTIEDNLGNEGVELLFRSVEEACYTSIQHLLNQYPQIKTIKSKLEMASILFQNCGLGVIHFERVRPGGGRVVSPSGHHVTGWLAKHGMRETPGCHFTRGWMAGALEAIYNRSPGFYAVEEKHCKMMRDSECVFHITEA